MNISLEKVGVGQIDELASLARQIWPDAFREIMPEDHLEPIFNCMYGEEVLKDQIEGDVEFFFILSELKRVGYCSIECDYETPGTVMVHKVYIHSGYQGKGIGRTVFSMIEKMAGERGQDRLRLGVYSKNAKAVAFYEKYGFVKEKTIKRVFADNITAQDYIMIKSVSLS